MPEPSFEIGPSTSLLNGSPKNLYTYFLLSQCAKYLDAMKDPERVNVDSATNSLLAFCPDVNVRNQLWSKYKELKEAEQGNDISASIQTIGDFTAYLSTVLEWTEKSTGGF